MSTTTLVTGASGHVGANLVRALLARGERVRVLVRDDTRAIDGLDVERVRGDVTSRQDVRAAVDGCERVYNVAAFVSLRNKDRDKLFDVNVLGTRKLLDACIDAGVRKVVHCSSFGAIGRNPNGGPSDETFTVNPNHVELHYEFSKAVSEHEVLRAALRGLDVTIVNPSGIIGPWDFKPSSVGKSILDFARGKMPAYVPGRFEMVSVHDVVEGHLLAMEKGERGERYILTERVHALDELLGWMSEDIGRPKPRVALPPAWMGRVASVKDWVEHRFFPDAIPRFTEGVVRLLQSGKSGDASKARRELGWEVRVPVRQALREQIAWFAERGEITLARPLEPVGGEPSVERGAA